MRLGDFRLHLLPDGEFRQDGGAVFGVVPKVMWEKRVPPDENNLITNTTNCLLVEAGSDLVLVDTGLGGKLSDKMRSIYCLDEQAPRMPDKLAAAGFEPGDVTHVLLTQGLGTKKTSSPDSLSLIMFEPGYLQKLMEIGEADAEENFDEIAKILMPTETAQSR